MDWLTSAHKVISFTYLWRGVAVGVEGGVGLIICLSPTDRFRYQKMYIIKIEGLIITNWLARHILISVTVFEIQGFEKSQKNTPTPNFGEILPLLCRPGETLNSQLRWILTTCFDPSQDVFATPSPWQTFFKNSFFKISRKIVKKRKKHPPPLILGKYYPFYVVQGRLSIPSLG